MLQSSKVFPSLCRYLLGAQFIISALLKLWSVDAFGTYIYGLDIFSFELSGVAARLLIGFEFTLGILLITRFFLKAVDWVAFLTLSLFSLFLLSLLWKGEDGNCYCFGETIEFTPLASLLKNLVFFALLYFGSKVSEVHWRYAGYFCPSLLCLSVLLCFILKWPYFLTSQPVVDYDEVAFSAFMEKNEHQEAWSRGDRLVAFVSPSCSHCRLLSRKIHSTLIHNNLPDSLVAWVVYDPKNQYEERFSRGEFLATDPTFMDGRILNITEGVLPLVLFLKDGKVVDKMSNRTFSEERLEDFFLGK